MSFVHFKDRDGLWDDVQPQEQYEGGEAPIAPIPYTEQFTEVMGYFRALFKNLEISERALDLTRETIMLNQGNYAAWHYRRKLLHELGVDLMDEIIFLNSIGLKMEKNYQIWNHRRAIFEMLARKLQGGFENLKISGGFSELYEQEVSFLDQIFESDSKNYHAWSHNIWLVERYETWSDQRHWDFVDTQLDNDVRNNSVWSFRYFLAMRSNEFSKELVEKECRYAITRLSQNWRNEAAWGYLRGMLANSQEEADNSMTSNAKRCFIGDFPQLHELFEKWGEWSKEPKFCPKMIEGQGDDQESIAQMMYDGIKNNRFLDVTLVDIAISKKQFEKAVKLLDDLKQFDPIRHKFWEWRKTQVQKLIQ